MEDILIGLYIGSVFWGAIFVFASVYPERSAGTDRPTRIYLAIPYSQIDHELSYNTANVVTTGLINAGHHVFSPISMSHGLGDLPKDWPFWESFDISFIEWCDELHVITLDGWEESEGVQAEIKIAERLGKPVFRRHTDGVLAI